MEASWCYVPTTVATKRRTADMICRLWRGWTTPENADAYERIVSTEVLPSIAARDVDGYNGAYLLRRDVGDEVEFATLMQFNSMDAVRAFAGEDYETAYVPPQAREVLARFDEKSAHYETLMTPGGG
jgi:antibiotic biosynthesis monooxygenase (ABM) superfamily enzyme